MNQCRRPTIVTPEMARADSHLRAGRTFPPNHLPGGTAPVSNGPPPQIPAAGPPAAWKAAGALTQIHSAAFTAQEPYPLLPLFLRSPTRTPTFNPQEYDNGGAIAAKR